MANFGETLKRERELREISLRQISEATKINIRYLEALEENRFDALPGGLFNKGFIRAYATCIGVDGEALVNSYLHELSGRQGGSDGGTARAAMHRPHDIPQRRATQPTERPSPEPAITAAQRRVHEPGSAAAEALRAALAHAPGDKAPGAPAVHEHQPRAASAPRPAVTGIEDADPHAPASSRVLMWVLSLVAVAGVLFLILSLARGTKPGPANASPDGDRPAVREGEPTVPVPESRPENGDNPGQADTSAVLPEVASQSPLMLGAAGTPPTKPAPPPTETPTPRPVVKRVPPAPLEAPVPWTEESDADTRDRAPRGPMKMEIEAVDKTFVVLVCDGREVLSRTMEAGEKERAKCDSVIRISASDAGAVRLSMNGDPCLPLGEPGTRAYGYTIHLDDSARICPPSGGGAHVGP